MYADYKCIKPAPRMARSCCFFTHCFLFSFLMYLSQLRVREDVRTAWWYLLSAC